MINCNRYLYKLTLLIVVLAPNAHSMDLMHSSGVEFNLREFTNENRWTVVQLWSLDCVSCERQKPMLDGFHRQHFPNNAAVIGIAVDGVLFLDQIRERVSGSDYRFESLVPKSDLFHNEYKALTGVELIGTPTYLFYGPDGDYVGHHAGLVGREQLEALLRQ